MKSEMIERIDLEGCTLVISRDGITLQTSDSRVQTADMDEYGAYQPIQKLMQLIPNDICVAEEITEGTHNILRRALVGEHPLLSPILQCFSEDVDRNRRILESINPQTEADYVRALCFIHRRVLYSQYETVGSFACREELKDHLCTYMDEESSDAVSEAVRKGLFFSGVELYWEEWEIYKEQLSVLPHNILNMFYEILYLPTKFIAQYIIHYAILLANSLDCVNRPTQ